MTTKEIDEIREETEQQIKDIISGKKVDYKAIALNNARVIEDLAAALSRRKSEQEDFLQQLKLEMDECDELLTFGGDQFVEGLANGVGAIFTWIKENWK